MQLFQHYIGGEFSDGQGQFESIDPSTGAPWALMAEASVEDVNHAVEAAHDAFLAPDWAGITATARGKLLFRLA
ncbi:MAG: aldehyde dehydrogenase family protein, partial [Rhizobiaceae bacterium]